MSQSLKVLIFLCALLVASSTAESGQQLSDGVRKVLQWILEKVVRFVLDGQKTDIATTPHSEIIQEYDFVVVGSGSSGAVVASRLSENGNWTVLLLEAGVPEGQLDDIAMIAPMLQWSKRNWDYRMEHQEGVCKSYVDQRCFFPRGKALGGSSIINHMIYTRGHKLDYDRWAAAGNPGWSYDEVLPFFMKSERVNLEMPFDADHHGHDGYLYTENVQHSEITRAFLDAGAELGGRIVDTNGKDQMGYSYVQGTLKNGARHSVARAFLQPFTDRPNLHILIEATVSKINIDPTTKVTTGVDVLHPEGSKTIRARKEVVLSAGAFHSPQLLMLSGVGPKAHLQELGIPVLEDLPVGQNLQNHMVFQGLTFLVGNKAARKAGASKAPPAIGGVTAVAFIKTKASQDPEEYPDVEIACSGFGSLHTDYGFFTRKVMGVADEYYNMVFRKNEGKAAMMLAPIILHPKSKSFIRLASRDVNDAPQFIGNYYTDERDRTNMVEAIKHSIRLTETSAYSAYNLTRSTMEIPECLGYGEGTDQFWNCALEYFSTSLSHQLGTCKMGPVEDVGAVVDARLRVHGVKGLRVADTSVIPFAMCAHTNAPAIMIGEKAADIIKSEWVGR